MTGVQTAAPPVRRRALNWSDVMGRLGPLAGLLLVFGLFSILRPGTFLNWSNVQLMLVETAVVATGALGMTIIIISGGIDLSVGASIALCTVVASMLLVHNVPPLLSALGGIASSTLCGLIIGLLVTRVRLIPFIVTLGMWGSVRGVAKELSGQTIIVAPTSWLNSLMGALPDSWSWMLLSPGVWIMLILALLTGAMLRYTRFGRHVFAIGSNEQTARLCGVRVERAKLLIYVIGAALVGVAGVLQFSYLTVGDPTTANGMELNIIAAVFIGGASPFGGEGTIWGSLIGALIMTVVANGCTKLGLNNPVQEIVTGAIIILAVALDRWRHAWASE